MRDYIAWLLEEDQEDAPEEETRALGLTLQARASAAAAAQETAQAAEQKGAARQTADIAPEDARVLLPRERQAETVQPAADEPIPTERGAVWAAEFAEASGSADARAESLLVAAREGRSASFYRRVQESGQREAFVSAPTAREARAQNVPVLETQTAGFDSLAVDRCFERDARRYDGNGRL